MKTRISKLIAIFVFLSTAGHVQSQNFWTKLNGPFGGEVISLKKSVNGNLYALRNEGLYVSSDNAENWNRLPESMVNSNLSMDINSMGTIYVGKSTGGIWWTQNNGQSWSFNPVNVAPHSGLWASVLLTKTSPTGHVYINSYVSFNGGTTFNQIQIGNPAKLPADYAFNSNFVYAATNTGVFYSENNGSSWTNISGNPPSLNVTSLMFDNNILVAGINGSGVYKTSDNGSTWEPINNGITDFSISKVYRDEQNNYYAGTNNGKVFKSVNAGSSWTEIYSSVAGNAITSISFDAGVIYLSTKNYGVLKSIDNGAVWNERNLNLHIPLMYSLEFSNTGEIFSGSHNGFQYSPDFGLNWQNRNNGLPSSLIYSVKKTADNKLLAGVYNLGIYSSSDKGLNWISSSNGISSGAQIKSIKSSPSGLLFAASLPVVFADTMQLYRSSDNGLNWISVLQPQSTGIDQFTIDSDGNLFVAGTNNMFQTSILISTNNGDSWNENIVKEFFFIQNFIASGKNLYMIASSHIHYSSDMGLTWSQIPNGSWTTSGFSAIGMNNTGHIFASIGNEVYVTTNMGVSWTLRNSGLSSNAVLSKLYFNDAGYIFGTTYSNGIYRSINSTITSVNNISNNSPGEFRLEQNYPNPFNPSTVIRYSLFSNSFVTLKVYDVLGNEIATLVNENQSRGNYDYHFSTVNYQLPSGIYFYKLELDNFTDTKRMILIK